MGRRTPWAGQLPPAAGGVSLRLGMGRSSKEREKEDESTDVPTHHPRGEKSTEMRVCYPTEATDTPGPPNLVAARNRHIPPRRSGGPSLAERSDLVQYLECCLLYSYVAYGWNFWGRITAKVRFPKGPGIMGCYRPTIASKEPKPEAFMAGRGGGSWDLKSRDMVCHVHSPTQGGKSSGNSVLVSDGMCFPLRLIGA